MRIYLAGPEVFLADSAAIAAAKRAICAAHGAEGVFPTDPCPDPAADAATSEAMRLYRRCEAHIRACDALIANLTPFRGPSADPGTVYEMGVMRGLGRPVFTYTNDPRTFAGRTLAFLGPMARRRQDGDWEDTEGMVLEAFGLSDNLMLDCGVVASGGARFDAAIAPGGDRWRDLTAFARCVAAAANRYAAPVPMVCPEPTPAPTW